jgi:hypothetical protein
MFYYAVPIAGTVLHLTHDTDIEPVTGSDHQMYVHDPGHPEVRTT